MKKKFFYLQILILQLLDSFKKGVLILLIYFYDGTFEGLLTSIYDGFYSTTPPNVICTKNSFEVDFLSEVVNIETNNIKHTKVQNSIITKIDSLCLKKLYYVFLSNKENKEMLCFNYLKLAFKIGSNIHKYLHNDLVKSVDSISKSVSFESHRLKGLIRFSYINEKFLYSSIEPDNNILELLSPHFQKRFTNEYWIIHDIKRSIASVYDGISWEIVEMNLEIYNEFKNYNDNFHKLWKDYFKATTINERLNLNHQKAQMPKRYWTHLTEFK